MSNDLCEELIIEIFSWLPPKSLLRFRSVSKSLCALIGSRKFIRLHTLRSPKSITLLHRIRYEGASEAQNIYTMHSVDQLLSYTGITPADYPFKSFRIIVGSCNGIICFYNSVKNSIHLWNPSIRHIATLHGPLPPWGLGLALGFYFDPVIDDYKILWSSTSGAFVYTLKTQTWREIAAPTCPNPSSFVKSCQCLFDGALHWVRRYNYHHYVMKFDLSSEVFSTIELPEPSWTTDALTVIKGCLAVVCLKDDDIKIWVRREYNDTGASWSLADLNGHELSTHGGLLLSPCHKKFPVYYPNKEVQCILVNMTYWSCIFGVITGIESLELLDTRTACDQGR